MTTQPSALSALCTSGPPRGLGSLAALQDSATLSDVLQCEIEQLRVEPLTGIGFSNSSLDWVDVMTRAGERRRFVLKRTRPHDDWIARRTADVHGREALLLADARFAGVWEIFDCPYVAFAIEPGEVGVLMCDLTPGLLPDVRQPLAPGEERTLLGMLARMHARFWGAVPSGIDWLARPAHYCDLLAPHVLEDENSLAAMHPMLRDSVQRGWASALARVTPAIRRLLERPGAELELLWRDVPQTLLHGDVKVANFAIVADTRVAAFDWAMAGVGPCTIDVGWYIAVNASRLTASQDDVLRRYRLLLEAALGHSLPDDMWRRLYDIAVIVGARMLLWSKAMALEIERPGAVEEWEWWVDRLAQAARS